MGRSFQSWSEAASKAAETYKAPGLTDPTGINNLDLSRVGSLSSSKQSEIPKPYKAAGSDLFDTSTASAFSGSKLNVERFYQHPSYKKLGISAYRDNDAYYNDKSGYGTDFIRAMKNFGPGLGAGFTSSYEGYATLLGGKALKPGLLDYRKGRAQEEAAAIAMSTKGGFAQAAVNIPFNLNYTLGIAASIAAEDLAMAALAPSTGGGSLVLGAANTVKGGYRIIKSLANIAKGARAFDKVADAKKIYSMAKGAGRGVANILVPETATQFGKFYRTSSAAGRAGRIGDATLHMMQTAKGFGSMYRDLRMVSLAIDESSVEAVGVRNGLMEQFVDEFSSKYNRLPNEAEYSKMAETADKGLTADYWANLPVIYLTNKLTFGNASLAPKFLKNYASATKVAGGKILKTATAGKVTAEALEQTYNPIKYIKNVVSNRKLAQAQLYSTAKYFKANLGEGVQELYQTGAATTFEDYYKNLYDNPNLTGLKNFKSSARKGINSLASQEGLEAFLGGLLGGGAVQGIFKTGRLGKEFIMSRNNPEQYEKSKLNEQEQIKAAVDLINEEGADVLKFLSPDLTTLSELINQNGTAYEFADAENFKGVEDIKATALYTKIQQLEASGSTDTFIDALSQMKQMEDSEKMEALGVDSVEKADKLIDVITERSQLIQSNIQYVNKNYQNPYNPNEFKIGTSERNQEILKQFAWEQAKKDLAFNYNQFAVTAQRLGDLYNSAINDPVVSEMTNRDFSVLFNTTLAESKKSGTSFETSLENEIGFLETEKSNVTEELSNIKEQIKTADEANKLKLNLRKTELENKLKALTKRDAALTKYASSIEKVKASRATAKEGVERPSEEKALLDLRNSFEEYLTVVAAEKNTFIDKIKLEETFKKLLDFIDVAEDNRTASNVITILSDPASIQKLSDMHFNGIRQRFDMHVSLSKMLALGFVESKRMNEFIESLEEIGVVITVEDMQALILENKIPTKYLSISEIDVDANGFVIENTPLWESIQEIADQFEMGRSEAEAESKEKTETKKSTTAEEKKFEDNNVVLKKETFIVNQEDGGRVEVTVKTYLDGSLSKAESVFFDADGNKINTSSSKLADNEIIVRDELTAEELVVDAFGDAVVKKTSETSGTEINNPKKIAQLTTEQKQKLGIETVETEETEENKKSSIVEQAAASQQATKEKDTEVKRREKPAAKKAKYQETAIRKELKGTAVLEKLDTKFKENNARLRKESKPQLTFTQFINQYEGIESEIKLGQKQVEASENKARSGKVLERYETRLAKAKTLEEVYDIQTDIETMPIIPEDLAKLDFQRRINEIKAEQAKNMGMTNVPNPTPQLTAPTGENREQAISTQEATDLKDLIDDKTIALKDKGGEKTEDDINNLLC